ncbi:hypothetical protein [Bacterioplanoides pacificum]|uniref:N-acetyltransferase domain-containing protein n=1 Tax=Bacterioplanoides pacificum TaxID=1171596 RepID=A0ABV7VQ52_9GAMM
MSKSKFRTIYERAIFYIQYGRYPKISTLLSDWKKSPDAHFHGYFKNSLKWSSRGSYGYDMSNIRCQYPFDGVGIIIGHVENVTMSRAGVATIGHFAVASNNRYDLTNNVEYRVGRSLILDLLDFMRDHNAIQVRFLESHSKKIMNYRKFFEKNGIAETEKGCWTVDLYPDGIIPHQVKEFLRIQCD